ncbi:DUF2786 domain-containing protein [Thiohalophilus thiocyanatoxydans]|uniref:Uncharacterized protein DUF2786 n=1 Tax=Thiohalophilus thiocyanatoxydans TaxID=381308 RepID=A0A4R8IJW5_9GAMM|nr:DUF2786 domain-containing protein [Thiohalophilus thiocyanatoxydans]TDY01032.1 uncharacterized protein DUF2786 [Thiohalophilus thiocyanatoxydans]
MNNLKIIDKICKCLRLSESANPNEAAAALRQAHRLMRKHRISEDQIRAAGVAESVIDSGMRYNPPFWAVALSNLVCEAFDCRVLVSRRYGRSPEFRFIGLEQAPQVAGYCFSVLYRQLERAREQFVAGLAIESRAERDRRGEVFVQAWLIRVARTVAEFSSEPATREAVDAYIREQYGDTGEQWYQDALQTAEQDYEAILSGMRAGDAVTLFRSIATRMRPGLPALKQSA